MKRLFVAFAVVCAFAAFACGGDDDSTDEGTDAATDVPVEGTTGPTPEEEFVVVGNCPAEPAPTGEANSVVPGLLIVGFDAATTIDEARTYLDMYVTDYRLGVLQYEDSRVAVICVEPGMEDAVTRSLPLGAELRFVQRYRIQAGF